MDIQQFLRRCLLSQWQPAARASVLAFMESGEIDWSAFQETVRRERIGPLLYAVLGNQGWLPDWVEAGLRAAYEENALRTAVMLTALEEILEALNEADIEAVVLKGAALAGTVYANPAVRFMTDLDLLVDETDVDTVVTLLKDLDYKMLPELRTGHVRQYGNELAMVTDPAYFSIEPHWYLLGMPSHYPLTNMTQIRPYTLPRQEGPTSGRVLCPELLLVHLCAHLVVQNQGRGLLRYTDILGLLETYQVELDWRRVAWLATHFQLVGPLKRTLNALEEEWGVVLPDLAKTTVNQLSIPPAERRATRYQGGSSAAAKVWAFTMGLPTWKERAGSLWDLLVPSRAYMQQRYDLIGPRQLPLAYVRRWWGGMVKLGGM